MKFIKSVSVVGGLTLVARGFGYIRDMLIAGIMGAGWLTDVFFVAFRIPNFLRRIFAEGAFSSAFVPLFAGKLEKEGKESALKLAEECQSFMITALIIITILAEIFMHPLVHLFTPGFAKDPEKLELAVTLTRITFPYLVFISLVALYGGVLNSLHHFAAFAAAPILLNICLIASLAALKNFTHTPAHAISLGVFVAGVAQFIWMIYFLHRAGVRIKLSRPLMTDNIRKLFTMMIPAVVGASAAQINLLVDTIIASLVPNSISYLYYADRICQLPLSVIGVAVGTVLLPSLSRQVQSENKNEAVDSLNRSLEFAMLLIIPAAFALFSIAFPIIKVLFEHGKFEEIAALATSHALMAFAFGLPAFVLVKILTPAFFARHDTKTPVKIALGCIVFNIIASLILIKPLAHVGIALSTSLSSWLNCCLLAYLLHKQGFLKADMRLKSAIRKICISAGIMAVFLIASDYMVFRNLAESHIAEAASLLVIIAGGLAILAGAAYFTKAIDINEIKGFLKTALAERKARKAKA